MADKPQDDSKYRVALDLALKISYDETAEKNRAYWLNLYVDCLNACHLVRPDPKPKQ